MFAAVALVVLFYESAFAADAAEPNPFEKPFKAVMRVIQGPIAISMAMGGIITTGIALIFGGEMRDFVKAMITLTLVICLIVFAGQIVGILFPSLRAPGSSTPFSSN